MESSLQCVVVVRGVSCFPGEILSVYVACVCVCCVGMGLTEVRSTWRAFGVKGRSLIMVLERIITCVPLVVRGSRSIYQLLFVGGGGRRVLRLFCRMVRACVCVCMRLVCGHFLPRLARRLIVIK